MIPVIYLLLVIAHAYYDSIQIKKGIFIKHRRELFYYALACFILFWVLLSSSSVLPLIMLPLITRLAWFDVALNLFRGKTFTYEGSSKDKRDYSFFDWLESWSNISIFWLRILYVVKYVSFLIFYYLWN